MWALSVVIIVVDVVVGYQFGGGSSVLWWMFFSICVREHQTVFGLFPGLVRYLLISLNKQITA